MPRSRSRSPERSYRRSRSPEKRRHRDRRSPSRNEKRTDDEYKRIKRERSHSRERRTERHRGRSTSVERQGRSRSISSGSNGSRSRSRSRSNSRHRSHDSDRRRHKRRHKHRRSKARKHRRHCDDDDDDSTTSSETSYDSSGSSSSESDSESYKRSRKHKKHKKSKKSKKHKKDKKSARLTGVVAEEFGKYGLIRETDMYTKEQEFHAWLIEVKRMSPEVMNQQQMKQHFKYYMEDYNTATLPHEKYYNMDKWEKNQYGMDGAWGQKMKGSGGDSVSAMGSLDLLRDEEQSRRQRASGVATTRTSAAPIMTKEQVEDLRRVQSERVAAEKLRKMGYQPKESMGIRYE